METRNGPGIIMSDFDYQQLDDIIHSRIRLAIMSILVSVDQVDFIFLKKQVNTTDGNLSVHLRKLEDADYITVTKTFEDRKPISYYQITPKGRKAFKLYVERLERFLKQ
jgi:DNA-binding MarR family transcriptional regulator